MRHKTLVKIQKVLSNYYTYFKENNVLAIGENSEVLPFAYVIFNKRTPKWALLSVSISYPNSLIIAEISLLISRVCKVNLSEPFYISPSDHKTYFNSDAYVRYDLEHLQLTDLIPISDAIN